MLPNSNYIKCGVLTGRYKEQLSVRGLASHVNIRSYEGASYISGTHNLQVILHGGPLQETFLNQVPWKDAGMWWEI